MTTHERRREFEDEALVHMDSLYHYALRLAQNRSDAEDLVQEAYLKAYQYFHQFDRGTNCRAWLMTILRNSFLNRMKKLGREILELDEGRAQREEDDSEFSSVIYHPEQEFFQRIMDHEVERALEKLPSAFREAVVLVDLEDCSYQEASKICGIPIGTVMSRLSRGRALLKKSLVSYARERGMLRGEE
jgi:RNA polymerase sigma-70 factor (ECF subfamily)